MFRQIGASERPARGLDDAKQILRWSLSMFDNRDSSLVCRLVERHGVNPLRMTDELAGEIRSLSLERRQTRRGVLRMTNRRLLKLTTVVGD